MNLLQVDRDSRGIVSPATMRQAVTLVRYPVPDVLTALVDRCWAVAWELPAGSVFCQPVLTHPCVNVSIGHAEPAGDDPVPVEGAVHGVARTLSTRRLAGTGWTVALMFRPGGFAPFVTTGVSAFTDRVAPLDVCPGLPLALVSEVTAAEREPARAAVLISAFADALDRADGDRVGVASDVTAWTRIAETDRTIRRVDKLAAEAGVGVRTLQRLFREYAGVSPAWMIRRYRLIEAAERVRDGNEVSWADVAAELGFTDQAHLIREFRQAIGTTPAAYAHAQRT